MSNVVDFYGHRNILITGSTGFLGKTLLEKILRSCPSIGKIFLIIRPKKDKSSQDRLNDLLKSEIFANLHNSSKSCFNKIQLIEGDLLKPFMGISIEELEKIKLSVSIVFHTAASVKFDEPLRDSVRINITGTYHVLQLCREMKHLAALIHVSTAYSNCDHTNIEEKIYDCPVKARYLMDAVEWMDNKMLTRITPMLLKSKPNTYTFTKNIAEALIMEEGTDLPIAIIRPSIIGGVWKEPIPGWVDNYNGPSGIFVAYGKGLLHQLLIDMTKTADIVPVDVPVNMMIAAAWYISSMKIDGVSVYNCTSSQENPLKWSEILEYIHPLTLSIPLDSVVSFPGSNFTTKKLYNNLGVYFHHYLPALFMDFFSVIFGKKIRMYGIYRRLEKSLKALEFFRLNEWNFSANNSNSLWNALTSSDQQIFYFKCSYLNWQDYISKYYLGIKSYLLKENMDELKNAKFLLKIRKYQRLCSYIGITLLFIKIFHSKSKLVFSVLVSLINIVLNIFKIFPMLLN